MRLSAQEQEPADSLVRLVKAQSIELYDQFGRSYRKTIDATFLHNGTYLICDTAIWCVDTKIINCWGHVQRVQDETVLTSDKLDYLIDEDLAQFRGSVVQLRNKKDNLLRTRNLDYNTKDSIAVFRDGGAMRDQDGQVVESREGTYNSTTKLFTFRNQVNMFTDSVFVKTSDLVYDGEQNRMEFVAYVDFWKDGNMLSAGWDGTTVIRSCFSSRGTCTAFPQIRRFGATPCISTATPRTWKCLATSISRTLPATLPECLNTFCIRTLSPE